MRARLVLPWIPLVRGFGWSFRPTCLSLKRVQSTSIKCISWPLIMYSYPSTHTTYWFNGRMVIKYCWNNWCRMWLVFTILTWKYLWLRLTRCLNALIMIPSFWKCNNSYQWMNILYGDGESFFSDTSRHLICIVDTKLST